MKQYLTSVTAACLAAGSVHAGALDRTGQSIDVLFEQGRYAEFSFGSLSPNISGVSIAPVGPFPSGANSGEVGVSNLNFGAAYKADINEKFSYAIIIDQPFKAETDYPNSPTYFARNSGAEFNATAVTALLQYNIQGGFSVYGGLRGQVTDANASISFARGYEVNANSDFGLGYVAGVAYERPDIALRVSLTYSSEIAHENDVAETFSLAPVLNADSVAEFETPQSLNLGFQTGVAPGTLLFGSVRWVDWSDFDLSPDVFTRIFNQPLLSYEEDIITYTIGLGYRINDTWSVAGSLGYEENTGNLFTNLGPADGQTSIGLAAIYSVGKVKITTGVRYAQIGDTTTAVQGNPAAAFNDNDAIAFGVKVGYSF